MAAITIMRNAGLEEAQAGIKIAGRNINNLRYADDPTLMTESKYHYPATAEKCSELFRKEIFILLYYNKPG